MNGTVKFNFDYSYSSASEESLIALSLSVKWLGNSTYIAQSIYAAIDYTRIDQIFYFRKWNHHGSVWLKKPLLNCSEQFHI